MNAPASPPIQTYDATGATPVMQQFFEMKARQPDALIFFRMGDFYELFFDDAYKAAAALGISQTFRGTHNGQPIPMAGVPQHAAEAYLSKLIRLGFKVAVCEQMEDPAEAKKRGSKSVVRRDIVRVVTPGTLTEDGLLDARGANRLAAVAVRAGQAAVAAVELSTGEVECFLVPRTPWRRSWRPWPRPRPWSPTACCRTRSAVPDPEDLRRPDPADALGPVRAPGVGDPGQAALRRRHPGRFRRLSSAEIGALGLIAAHLEMTQAGKLPALRAPRRAAEADVMAIDPATRSSLEIDRTQNGDRNGSLLACHRPHGDRRRRPDAGLAPGPAAAGPAAIDAAWTRSSGSSITASAPAPARGAEGLRRHGARPVAPGPGRGGPRDLGCIRDTLKTGEKLAGDDRGSGDAAVPPPPSWSGLSALTPSLHEGLVGFLAALEDGPGSRPAGPGPRRRLRGGRRPRGARPGPRPARRQPPGDPPWRPSWPPKAACR
jgi:DNA mismatch repair protein MutS